MKPGQQTAHTIKSVIDYLKTKTGVYGLDFRMKRAVNTKQLAQIKNSLEKAGHTEVIVKFGKIQQGEHTGDPDTKRVYCQGNTNKRTSK